MKILGLRFKNVTSLRGEWHIRFDAPPLSDTGLFAITGPNGSGKSSILDAVTLGLYGETVRLRNPEKDITTWLEDESYAEVTFRVGDTIYRSRWWARKGPEGLTGPEMSLSVINGTENILEDRIIRVRTRLSEITGLDFKRFCRSVLLAQGQFAAFLNALENERADILEKIIGAEVTQELGEDFKKRSAAAQERLLQLKEQAAALPAVDRERVRELERDRDEVRAEWDETLRQIAELEEEKERLLALEQRRDELHAAQEACAEAEAREASARREVERLEKILAVRPLADELRDLRRADENRNGLRERLDALRRQAAEERERLQSAREELALTRQSLETARQRLLEKEEAFHDAFHRDEAIEEGSQRLQDALSRSMERDRLHDEALNRLEQLKGRLLQTTSQLEALQDRLSRTSADAGLEKDLVGLEDRIRRLVEARSRREVLEAQVPEAQALLDKAAAALNRALSHEQHTQAKAGQAVLKKEALEQQLKARLGDETRESLKERLKERKRALSGYKKLLPIARRFYADGLAFDIQGEREQLSARRTTLQASLEEALAEIKNFENDLAWRDSFQRVSPERERLREGFPCPLCGSTTHPFLTQGLPDLAERFKPIDALQNRIGSLKAELADLDRKAAVLDAQADAAARLLRAWDDVCRRAGLNVPMMDPRAIVDAVRSEKAAIREAKSVLRSARFLQWRLAWSNRVLHRTLGKFSKKEQERHLLQEQHDARKKAVLDLQDNLRRLRDEAEAATAELHTLLAPYGEEVPGQGAERRLLDRLRMRWNAYRRSMSEEKTLRETIRSLEAEIQSLTPELERLRKEAEAAAAEADAVQAEVASLRAERDSLYPGPDPVAERRALEESIQSLTRREEDLVREMEALTRSFTARESEIFEVEKSWEAAEAAWEATRADLEVRVRALGLDSLETAFQVFQAMEEEPVVRHQAAQAAKAADEARSRLKAAEHALDEAAKRVSSGISLEGVSRRLAERHERRESLRQSLEELERHLVETRRWAQEHRELLRAVEEQERLCAQLISEEKAFWEEQSAEVREKFRRHLLERLVAQANTHLELLSGRYRLRASADDGFGLEVEDLMQHRNRRPLRTLSGGETFVVSLSMALGLSDLAAQHRKIESLFLDEGFGVLDDEMLYRVMTALRRLQANGKTVGIISHVKRLAEEIQTQIRVEREPGGMSRITVVP
uniref:Rad50/SbcC-type AAA domain-containing protein n=1 Tax=Desulfacinum infernum TaxID=35837 RepID=A0A832EC25_9BACT